MTHGYPENGYIFQLDVAHLYSVGYKRKERVIVSGNLAVVDRQYNLVLV